jgi:hypothetical protein
MTRTRLCVALSAVVLSAAIGACDSTTRGEATAPSNVRPLTTTTTTTTTTSTTTATSEPPLGGFGDLMPPQAYEEIRATGVTGTDQAISDVVDIACIVAEGDYATDRQGIVENMKKLGSELSDRQLNVLVSVALTYMCPDQAAKYPG